MPAYLAGASAKVVPAPVSSRARVELATRSGASAPPTSTSGRIAPHPAKTSRSRCGSGRARPFGCWRAASRTRPVERARTERGPVQRVLEEALGCHRKRPPRRRLRAVEEPRASGAGPGGRYGRHHEQRATAAAPVCRARRARRKKRDAGAAARDGRLCGSRETGARQRSVASSRSGHWLLRRAGPGRWRCSAPRRPGIARGVLVGADRAVIERAPRSSGGVPRPRIVGVHEEGGIRAPGKKEIGWWCLSTHLPALPEYGKPTASEGAAQLAWIDEATDLVKAGFADALGTGPVSKAAIASSGVPGADIFRGHTEHLGARLGASEVIMAFAGGALITALVTTHLAIANVLGAITREGVASSAFWLARLVDALLSTSPPRGRGARRGTARTKTRRTARRRTPLAGLTTTRSRAASE